MIYRHTLPRLGGGLLDLNDLRRRMTLIVNVASQCGLTPQYEGCSGSMSAMATAETARTRAIEAAWSPPESGEP